MHIRKAVNHQLKKLNKQTITEKEKKKKHLKSMECARFGRTHTKHEIRVLNE